jgi:flavodoxin
MGEKQKAGGVLVAYYSFEGNTRFIAEAIASDLKAEIMELKPVKDLKSKGFGKYVWGGRQVVTKKEPELMRLEKNPADYDLIFIGSPVWVYTYAPALRTFFKEHPFKGKRLALFMCHGGGPKDAMAKMEAAVPGNTIVGRLELQNALGEEPEEKRKTAVEWARKCMGR